MEIRATIQTLLRDGFILVFNQDKLDVTRTAEALREAGINNIEITCRIKRPLEALRRLKDRMPDFVVGVASLIDFPPALELCNAGRPDDPVPTVEEAAAAGADFLVSAGNFRPETYDKFAGKVPIIPGCATVTEIVEQFSLGANFVKVFPAKQLGGPDFLKAVDAPLHKIISLIPMGGTNPANFRDYIEAGALILGGSFSAVGKGKLESAIADQNYAILANEFTKIAKLLDALRNQKWPAIDFASATVEDISRATGRNFNLPD